MSAFRIIPVSVIGHLRFGFVSDFDIRISNLRKSVSKLFPPGLFQRLLLWARILYFVFGPLYSDIKFRVAGFESLATGLELLLNSFRLPHSEFRIQIPLSSDFHPLSFLRHKVGAAAHGHSLFDEFGGGDDHFLSPVF